MDAVIFCNPILDLIDVCDDEWFTTYQLEKDGYTMYEPGKHRDIYDAMIKRPNVLKLPGGSGQNTARMLKACWRAGNVNKTVAFVGCVGADENDQQAMDKYACVMKSVAEGQDQLHCCYDVSSKHPSGVCAVCVNKTSNTRSLCTLLGATQDLSSRYLTDIQDVYQNCPLTYVTGFFVTANEQGMRAICRDSKGILVLSLSAPFIVSAFTSTIKYCGQFSNVIIGNELEWETFRKFAVLDPRATAPTSEEETTAATERPAGLGTSEILADVARNGTSSLLSPEDATTASDISFRLVICTRGARETLVAFKKQGLAGILEMRIPVAAVGDVVDTNGAGDAFLGGLLSGVEKVAKCTNYEEARTAIQAAVERGTKCAACVLHHSGFNFKLDELAAIF